MGRQPVRKRKLCLLEYYDHYKQRCIGEEARTIGWYLLREGLGSRAFPSLANKTLEKIYNTAKYNPGANFTKRLRLSLLSFCIRLKPPKRLKSVCEIGPSFPTFHPRQRKLLKNLNITRTKRAGIHLWQIKLCKKLNITHGNRDKRFC